MNETHGRPWWRLPKLNLRDLFWLVLVVAMGCGWWVSYRRQASEIKRLEAAPKWSPLQVYLSPG